MSALHEHPLEPYLKQGLSVRAARQLLEANHCLDFPQFRSGMFPARNVENLNIERTGMANAWLRDTAAIGLVLLEDGQTDVAAKAAYGVLGCLGKIGDDFRRVIALGHAPADPSNRPPISFIGQDSRPRRDWGNAQNDALGYVLQFVARAAAVNAIELASEHKALLQLVLDYLQTIAYWQDADSGCWEEDRRIRASSIGTVLAGLNAVQRLLNSAQQIDRLITQGNLALDAILPNESLVPARRTYDGALVFLVEPLHAISGSMADQIIAHTEAHLVGHHGVRRYIGDSYWAPNYRAYYTAIERSGNFSAYADLARRDKLLTPGNEAQWTLFDPLLSAYYAHMYQVDRKPAYADKAARYLMRSLLSVATYRQASNGKVVWHMPEAYFLENNHWIPNDNPGLLWAQANLIHGLNIFKEVFGDTLLTA